MSRRPLERSAALQARAARVIPAHTQTLSKNPTQWLQGLAPGYIVRGEGAHVWDVDGNRYLDFPMALGPVVLGHSHPGVNEAIERQLRDGITFTLPHPLEVEVAEMIVGMVPGAEQVRFAKTGSDANSAAVRLARAHTGRDHVLVCGYHGWHDWYIGSTSRRLGVPDAVAALTHEFAFNDIASLEAALAEHEGQVAAVILEPAGATEPAPGFLQAVVDRARAAGAVAIFDEVITGFRLAPGGAQEHYGVQADLATYGKALGNGMPISAIAGRAELMQLLEEVFFSGTHGGETLGLAAARFVLGELDHEACAELHRKGEALRARIQSAAAAAGVEDWVTVGGAAPRTVVTIREPAGDGETLPAKSLVQQEMLRHGVLFNGSNFVCLAHTDHDLDHAGTAYAAAFEAIAAVAPDGFLAALEAEPLRPAFRPVG